MGCPRWRQAEQRRWQCGELEGELRIACPWKLVSARLRGGEGGGSRAAVVLTYLLFGEEARKRGGVFGHAGRQRARDGRRGAVAVRELSALGLAVQCWR